jgi:hypothetical protein
MGMSVFSELNQANNRNGDLLTEISRLQAENAELKEQRRAWEQTVLEPFAKAADKLEKCRDDRPLWAALDAGWAQREAIPLTVGDLRRARAALME